MMQKGLSVVLPVYDTGDVLCARIPSLRKTLESFFEPIELIVVDDGNCLSPAEIERALPGVRLFRNKRNLGKGASILLGLHASRHQKVLFTDGDIPFDLESYARIARGLQLDPPVIIGCRRRPESQILVRFDALPYVARRHLVGLGFNRIVRLLTGLPYSDTQCGLKAFDRGVALSLFRHVRDSRFLFDVELLLAAKLLGVEVVEVPVCVVYEDSRSTMRTGLEAWRMGRDLFRVWRRLHQGAYLGQRGTTLLDRVQNLTQEVTPDPP